MSRQCELLGLSRSSYYYEPATESAENLALMALIDREYTAIRSGQPRHDGLAAAKGHEVNRKRVQRLMRLMGLEAVYPKPRLSVGGAGPQGLSVPAAGRGDRAARPGVEHGYHVYSHAEGVHVPDGGDRLVSAATCCRGGCRTPGRGRSAWRRWRRR